MSRARAKHLERVVKILLQRPNDEQCVTRTEIIAMAGGEAKGGLAELIRGDRGGPSRAIDRAIAQMIPAPALKRVRGGRGKVALWAPVTYVWPSTVAAAGAGEAGSRGRGGEGGRSGLLVIGLAPRVPGMFLANPAIARYSPISMVFTIFHGFHDFHGFENHWFWLFIRFLISTRCVLDHWR